jgi:hypothetical protein
MFRYRLHSPDGDDLGEATYAMMIHLGDEIHLDAGQRFRVIDVVPFEEEDESLFVGYSRSRQGRVRSSCWRQATGSRSSSLRSAASSSSQVGWRTRSLGTCGRSDGHGAWRGIAK